MNPSSPLNQLRDIHPPADIGWWPLAISWWVLLTLLVTLIVVSLLIFIKHRRKNAWRRSALKELQHLNSNQEKLSNNEFARQLSILIKRCLASADRNTPSTLAATNSEFADILKAAPSKQSLSDHFISTLCYEIYKAECPSIEKNDLACVVQWVKGLRNV